MSVYICMYIYILEPCVSATSEEGIHEGVSGEYLPPVQIPSFNRLSTTVITDSPSQAPISVCLFSGNVPWPLHLLCLFCRRRIGVTLLTVPFGPFSNTRNRDSILRHSTCTLFIAFNWYIYIFFHNFEAHAQVLVLKRGVEWDNWDPWHRTEMVSAAVGQLSMNTFASERLNWDSLSPSARIRLGRSRVV